MDIVISNEIDNSYYKYFENQLIIIMIYLIIKMIHYLGLTFRNTQFNIFYLRYLFLISTFSLYCYF